MEQQLTNKEIAKVFAMYFDAEIGQINSHGKWDYNLHMQRYHIAAYHQREGNVFEGVKLLLKPLSKLTDEDYIAIDKIANKGCTSETMGIVEYTKIWLPKYLENNFVCQYLISKGYAVPLWFGIDHWANGKTAIELNIAIHQ